MRRRIWVLAAGVALAACGAETPVEESAANGAPEGAVATWSGGAASLSDVEARLAVTRTPACRQARSKGGAVDDLVPCYREIAEELALEASLVAAHGDAARAIAEGLGPRADEILRNARVSEFHRQTRDAIEVSDAEASERLASAPETQQQAAQLSLWNIFRRHEDPEHPDKTLEFLRKLKERAEAGETFTALAREYSHSETRLRDGQVGTVAQGRLPKRLEEIAFALPDGGVSDPVLVRGGAVLLYVRNVRAPQPRPAAQAERSIRQQIVNERFAEAVAQRLASIERPPGARILEHEALPKVLDDGAPEDIALEIDGAQVSVARLRSDVGLRPSQRAGELGERERERLLAAYDRQIEALLLAMDLRVATDPVAVRVREQAEPRARQETLVALVDAWLQERLQANVAATPELLRKYYDDNQHTYRAPLRFDLSLWTLPFGADPPGQLASMERLREKLEAGALSLEAAAKQLGGSVRKLGVRDLDDLPEIPEKAQSLLLQTPAGGFVVPYQEDEAIHLIHVVARQEPSQRSYDEAQEQVRDDYVRRFGQRLSREIVATELEGLGFAFLEEQLRQQLAPGTGH